MVALSLEREPVLSAIQKSSADAPASPMGDAMGGAPMFSRPVSRSATKEAAPSRKPPWSAYMGLPPPP